MDKEWKNLLKTKLKTYDPRLANAVYKAKLDDIRADYACDNFKELSAKGFAAYDGFNGEENNNLKNGYIKLIQHLNSNIPKKAVKLSESVEKIDWSLVKLKNSTGLITVKTNKDSYQAKRVVTTVSLGVLKSSYKQMFTPSLPANKTDAINRLGFGTVNKIFFIFNNSIFTGNKGGLQFLWANNTKFVLDADKKCNLKV